VTDGSGSGWDGAAYDRVNGLQRWVADRSLAALTVAGDEQVLDVGCGDGRITAEVALRVPRGSVLGIDPSPRMIEVARSRITPLLPNLSFVEGVVETLDQVDSVDLVVSFNALHWVSDHRTALARMRRALRRDGRALLQFVCEGERPSVEDVAAEVGGRPTFASWLSGVAVPFHHAAESVFLDEARGAGFEVAGSRVEDLAWDFEDAERLRDWLRVGFSSWLDPLPEGELRDRFLDDVAVHYADVVGSHTVVRFLQLRTELEAR
jgi:trans-aconitate 2-methyltransferase